MDSEPLMFDTVARRRVLGNKLVVLRKVTNSAKETVKEALLVASKLQQDILRDLRLCPQHNLELARDLQQLYIQSIEITLSLLKALESHGSVMIGSGEFLPNEQITSVDVRIQNRILQLKIPPGTVVYGMFPPVVTQDVVKRQMDYVSIQRMWMTIEYSPNLTENAKNDAAHQIVTFLKSLIKESYYEHVSRVDDIVGDDVSRSSCYLCLHPDEYLCGACKGKVLFAHFKYTCRKVGNAIFSNLLATPAEATSRALKASSKARAKLETSQETVQVFTNKKAHLNLIRQANAEKQRRIDELRRQLVLLKQDKTDVAPLLQQDATMLASAEAQAKKKRELMPLLEKTLSDARYVVLQDLKALHAVTLFEGEMTALPGYPRIPVPSIPGPKGGMAPSTSNANLATSSYSGTPALSHVGTPVVGASATPAQPGNLATSTFMPATPATPSALSSTAPTKTPAKKSQPIWYFLNLTFYSDGSVLRSMPHPLSNVIPLFVFLEQFSIWWNCPLPYPIEALPIPRIYDPSIIETRPRPGSENGFHAVPTVSPNDASASDIQIHQRLADNVRAVVRAVNTFPQEFLNLEDHWLNALLLSCHDEYIRAFRNYVPSPVDFIAERFHTPVPVHRTRSNSRPLSVTLPAPPTADSGAPSASTSASNVANATSAALGDNKTDVQLSQSATSSTIGDSTSASSSASQRSDQPLLVTISHPPQAEYMSSAPRAPGVPPTPPAANDSGWTRFLPSTLL